MKQKRIELILEAQTNEASLNQGDSKTHRDGSMVSTGLAGVVIGVIAEVNESGEPVVDFRESGSRHLLAARSTVALTQQQVGMDAILTFERGDLSKPIVLGLLHSSATTQSTREIQVDDERLVLTAQKEIVLRCGEASITLTRAGKVLIRGAYLVSRSSGVNRIKGGSVQIN